VTGSAVGEALRAVLEESRALGFLGPGPVEAHVEGARALADVVGMPDGRVLDLGSGGGVPGLVLALEWAGAEITLLDASARRTAFLRAAAGRLGLDKRVDVVVGRAEDLARSPELRERFSLVVARGFGVPAVTAECGVGFLVLGGLLAVTEPPPAHRGPARWPAPGLERLGLSPAVIETRATTGVAKMRRVGALDRRYPRRSGIPAKRPLWTVPA
jgi:16S rRNA (guanine527-N7)-methyltransferase